MPSETSLVRHIRSLAAAQPSNKRLIKGIGDDCAILRPRPGHDLVFTTDLVLEGRHFTLETHKPADIGHKALARSLSDLAAMGSRPLFCLVSLAVPQHLGQRWINGFYRGLLGLAARHETALAGGDLASFDRVLADVVCCGEVPAGQALLRSKARPGDSIYVTGTLGASAAGFRTQRGVNWKRHLRPEPRVAQGEALRKLGVTCCMDLSDGLSLDLRRLCLESRVSADLAETLPIARGATLEDALHGGEDYELLFTASPRVRVPEEIAAVPIARIGTIGKGKPGAVTFAARSLRSKGFDHFG